MEQYVQRECRLAVFADPRGVARDEGARLGTDHQFWLLCRQNRPAESLAYVASKTAVLGFTRAVAGDLAPHGITCNAIAPGFFDTDMAAPTVGHPRRAKIFKDAIAMGRFGRPEEITGTAIYLASEAASYVTGQMIHVDGGVNGVLSLPVVVET